MHDNVRVSLRSGANGILGPSYRSSGAQFLSFYDEGDQPTQASTRAARPRRPATAARGPSPPDRQTARTRQAIGLGALIIVAILIILGVKGCLDSRKDNAMKDYNRNVTAVIDDSDNTVGKPFFARMSTGSRNAQDLQVQINQLRLAADDDVKRAKSFSVPGDMTAAQRNLELVLNLRAESLKKIADQIPSALGRGQTSESAIDKIAAEMQGFLASDVVHQTRVAPLIRDALDKNGITGQTIRGSRFLPSLSWLSPRPSPTGWGAPRRARRARRRARPRPACTATASTAPRSARWCCSPRRPA